MELYNHQKEVLDATKSFNKCAYYLDMGLGKTFVGSEKMMSLNCSHNLLICQKSKISDWIEHFKEYYSIDIYDLTNKNAINDFMAASRYHKSVGIINYELAFRREELLKLRHFTLMLDESSLIQNEKAKRAKFVLKLKADNVILLSGTPTSGKYERLWSQCKLLGWDISKSSFWNNYIIHKWIDYGTFGTDVVLGYKHVNELRQNLKNHGAVFMKTEDVLDLPAQIEQQIRVNNSSVYKQFKKHQYVIVDDLELVGDNVLTRILYERQLCGQYSDNKLSAFKDLISSTEDRLIVFYNFNSELDKMIAIAKSENRPISQINGACRDLTAYNNADNSITFVQYQAGAMGLNLQKANKIIYFTLPLGKGSCDLWEQSKKRIHRIGQTKSCFYYYLLVNDSIEKWNLELLKKGKELTDDLFLKNI